MLGIEALGDIRQLHQMQSLPCEHFPLLDSHVNPPLRAEAFFATILIGDSAHTGAGSENSTRLANIEPKNQKPG